MSYILDALKKADQERTLGEVPDLEAAHWGERRAGRSYRWIWGIVALLVVNGVLLALLVGRDADDEAVPPASPDAAAQLPVEPQARTGSRAVENPRLPMRPRAAVPVQPTPMRPAAPANRTSAPAPAPATMPVSPPPQPQADASDVASWDELPLEFRSRMTLPHLDVHVYSDEPRRRFILVDLLKYREGDTLENGAVLEEILPDSIQLYYEGTRFRMEK